MDDRKWQQAKRILAQALDATPEERAALIAACDDAEVRREVEELLGANDHVDPSREMPRPDTAPPAEAPGAVIGPYKLLQQIGEGGFGVVYMAEQTEPVHRKVALKVIRLGMDTRQVIARFEVERQALALMDHPNIAKVLDAGETKSGRPYFVMELVKGIPITEYCDQAKLDVAARLDLFTSVCAAVQHAHQKGIIHRDLKPGNVLVTLHDGKPVPKVIDFGIAKATDRRLTEKTLFTEFRQMIGTPDYMSPEQAELSGLDIDARSDIYSLGVLLYELLTGTKPFDLATLMRQGYDEILRTIREVDPPKPSTRASTTGAAVVGGRTPSAKLLRGDLDWIVMKALEKDRSRRYETANALASDIGRYLCDEPVLASPPGAVYRVRKYLKRHRIGVTAAALVCAALLVSATLAYAGRRRAQSDTAAARGAAKAAARKHEVAEAAAARARAQRERAEASTRQARRETKRAEAFLGFFEHVLGPDGTKRGAEYTLRELLDDFHRELGTRLSSYPAVEATVQHTMGEAYRSLGLRDEAEPLLRVSLEARRRLFGEQSEPFVESLRMRAALLHDRGDYRAARKDLQRALQILHALPGDRRVDIGTCQGTLSDYERHLGLHVDAEAAARKGVALLSAVRGSAHPDVAMARSRLASVLTTRGAHDEAEQCYREALAIRRAALGGNHPAVASCLAAIARINTDRYQVEEAEKQYKEALAIDQAALGETSAAVARDLLGLGLLFMKIASYDRAEECYRRALTVVRTVHGDRHPHVVFPMANLAEVCLKRGDVAQAEELLRRALVIARGSQDKSGTVTCLQALGVVLHEKGALPEAEKHLREALAIARGIDDDAPAIPVGILRLAAVVRARGAHDEAERLHREALEFYRRTVGDEHHDVATVLNHLGALREAQKKHDDAKQFYARALAIRRKSLGERHPKVADSMVRLALVARRLGDPKGAEQLLRRALEVLRASVGDMHPSLADATNYLARVLADQKRYDEAERHFQAALEMKRKLFGDAHRTVALTLHDRAFFLNGRGRHAEAAKLAREAATILRKAQTHPRARATALITCATALYMRHHKGARGALDEAQACLEESLAIRRRECGPRHLDVAANLTLLAAVLGDKRRFDEAEKAASEALAIRRSAKAPPPMILECLYALVGISLRTGDIEGTEERYREMLPIMRRHERNAAMTALTLLRLALIVRRKGARDEAERYLREAMDFAGKATPRWQPQVAAALQSTRREFLDLCLEEGRHADAESHCRELLKGRRSTGLLAILGMCLSAQDKHAEAATVLRECLAARRKTTPGGWLTFNAMSLLGEALTGLGKYAEAEPLLLEGYEKMQPPERAAHRKREALERIVKLYQAWGKAEQAARWKAALKEMSR